MSPPTPTHIEQRTRMRFSIRQLLFWVLLISVGLALLKFFADGITVAQRAARTNGAISCLNQTWMGLSNYHSVYGCFPPAIVTDAQGQPMHSWRVLILPYIEEEALYRAYDFNEPWNGPNNSQLFDQMPRLFNSPTEPESTKYTNVVTIVGPQTAFPGTRSACLDDISDGAEDTILITEITDSKICWTEPRDLDFAKMSFAINDPLRPSISCAPWRSPYVAFADQFWGYPVTSTVPPEVLRAMITIDGNEGVLRTDLEDQGHLKQIHPR